MKTAELIAALARDVEPAPPRRAARTLRLAIFAGLGVSLALLLIWLGLRPLGAAVRTLPFWMKAAYTGVLSLAGLVLVSRLARPGESSRGGLWIVLAAVAVMVALGAAQLLVAPPDQRLSIWLGQTWAICPFNILALAVPIFAAALWGLRRSGRDGLRPALPGDHRDLRRHLVHPGHSRLHRPRGPDRIAISAVVTRAALSAA
jgi:hypothetical protein